MILNEKGGRQRLSRSPGCFSGVRRETGPWASSSGVLGSDLGRGGREGEAVSYTSIPRDAPVPRRYLFAMAMGGAGGRMWRGGLVQSLPRGWEERCCGVLSLAKIWTGELRDSGSPPARHRDPGPQLCSPSLRVAAPGLLQLFTSRIITQEKQLISLREKRGSIHHSIYNTAETSCQNKHTHTHTHKYCEQKNTGND